MPHATRDIREVGPPHPPGPLPVDLADVRRPAVDALARLPGLGSTGRSLRRTELVNEDALPLWVAILQHTEAIGFRSYQRFINDALGAAVPTPGNAGTDLPVRVLSFATQRGLDPYQLLRSATEMFLLRNSGVWNVNVSAGPYLAAMLADRPPGPGEPLPDQHAPLPADVTRVADATLTRADVRARLLAFLGTERASYIDAILPTIVPEGQVSASPFSAIAADPELPCLLELIWSYWHKRGCSRRRSPRWRCASRTSATRAAATRSASTSWTPCAR